MKRNKYRHSKIKVIDYPFDWKYLEEIDDNLVKNICKFNKCTNINEKIELSKLIPIEFPKCRFCGKIIINLNFKIALIEKYIKIKKPSVYCREIDNKKYYLSCCENCLLEHFKDDPPKSTKYYFMKANKYGAYSFGYSEEEYHKLCSYTIGVTEENMIRKWGEDLGKQKWKEYCNKQAITNTFEYKHEKYGWDKETFDKFNASRAITKENLIKKYGEEKGLDAYNNYCEQQRYTCTLEYFIKKYGKDIGKEKYNIFCEQRILKGGWISKAYSKISLELFNIIKKCLEQNNINNEILYGENEYYLRNYEYDIGYKIDFYDKTKNLIIEFNGNYWHCNPKFYDKNFYHKNKLATAQEIWDYDEKKKKFICENLNNPIYIEIWESDYKENKYKIIKDILLYYNINLNLDENELPI